METALPTHYPTRESLDALRRARLGYPRLDSLLAMHEQILSVQADIEDEGEWAREPLPLPETRVRALYYEGTPWLTFGDLALSATSFAAIVARVTAALRPYRTDWVDESVKANPETLLALAQQAIEGRTSLINVGATLTASAVELALEGIMRGVAVQVVLQLDLELWRRAACPFCGSQPALALLEPSLGRRFLFCQRCHTSWPYRRVGCTFCSNEASLTYHETDHKAYRLYTCPVCQTYLKTVDLRALPLPANPVVENLLTVGLDLVAANRGLGRGTEQTIMS